MKNDVSEETWLKNGAEEQFSKKNCWMNDSSMKIRRNNNGARNIPDLMQSKHSVPYFYLFVLCLLLLMELWFVLAKD